MPELDRLKVMVVTEVSLVAWLITTYDTADRALWALAAVAAAFLGCGIFLLHRQIEQRIEEIGRL